MEIRAIAPNEWKYTYSQSMQITGQTGNIGHLRGDFDSGGYGFYTTWNDHRPQWKTDEFKTELDEVINALRSPEYGLLQNRPAMSEYARRFPDSAFKGNYCTEYGLRVDTEKYAYLLRLNPTKGDYNFYCYCYVKEWLDKHIGNAEKGIRFIDSHYKDEVCKKIREISHCPILFLSSKNDELDKILGLAVGGDDYVTKPFSPKEIAYRVKAQLRRAEYKYNPKQDFSVRIGELMIDADGCRVMKNNKEIELTAREFEILQYLAQNVGRVISRERLYETVWGEDSFGCDNTIMVHIRHLREKLEDNPTAPQYIITMKGLGYKLVNPNEK